MTVNIAADGHQLAKIFDLESRGSTRQSGKEIQSEILERKKADFRWNTLCISRKNNAFPEQKIDCSPQANWLVLPHKNYFAFRVLR